MVTLWTSNDPTLLAPEAVAKFASGRSFAWLEFPRTFRLEGRGETYIAEQLHDGTWQILRL